MLNKNSFRLYGIILFVIQSSYSGYEITNKFLYIKLNLELVNDFEQKEFCLCILSIIIQ